MERIPKQKAQSEWDEIEGSDIGYGPRLEKTAFEQESNQEDLSEEKLNGKTEWLSKGQRRTLQATLLSLGIAVAAVSEKNNPSEQEGVTANLNTNENIEAITPDKFSLEVELIKSELEPADIEETIKLANKPTLVKPEYTRIEYPQIMMKFRSEDDTKRNRPALPEVLQEDLRDKIPGWIAQESRYKAGAVSKSEATGLWQIKPWVYKGYNGTDKVSKRIEDQTRTAEEIISDNYHYILHFAGEEAVSLLRKKFNSEEAFLKDLMSPLMVNAYNAGGPAIGRLLKKFVQQVSDEKMLSGRDLFLQFADFAKADGTNYSKEAREYVPRVYAFNEVLNPRVQKESL